MEKEKVMDWEAEYIGWQKSGRCRKTKVSAPTTPY